MFRYHALTIGLLAALTHGAGLAEAIDPQSLLIQQGHFWQAQDRPQRAAEAWNKVLQLDPRQPEALYGLGVIELEAKRTQKAGDYLGRLKALQPLPRQALQLEQDIALASAASRKQLEAARLLVDSGEREKAAVQYRKLLAGREPQGLIAREYYNNLAFTDGGWSEGRAGLERLVRERPDDSIVALFLAKHLARREDTRAEGIKALAELSRRVDIAGDADESRRLALTWMGAPNKAQAPLFEAFLKDHPEDEEIRTLLAKGRAQGGTTWQRDPGLARGLKALEQGDRETAERELSARLKNSPNDADALGGLGVLRQQQNRLEDAEVLLTRATRQQGGAQWQSALDDVRYWSLLQRARASQAKGEPGLARSQIEQAVRLKPRETAGQAALADLQARQGRFAEAEAGYRRLLAQSPNDPDARRGLISVLTQAGKNDEALRLIEALPKAEQAGIGDLGRLRAEQAMQRARLAEQRGDLDGTRQALEDALRNDPNNAWTRFALARLYVGMGSVQEARSLVDGLLVSQPDDPDALYTSALLSVELGEWPQAQTTLARIPAAARTSEVNRLVGDVDFHLQLQQINDLAKSGRRQDARVFLARTEALAEGRPERLSALASAYADAGDPVRATAMLRDLLARSPRPEPGLTLRYAGILLQTEQDVEVSAILRDLQGQPLNPAERKQYDDLLFLYRVRQAEHLRERGDLVAAYDTLAPALAQRPQDGQAVSALARMYAASGNPGKALELYKPLLQREPDNAQLQIGAADMAAQVRDGAFAERALERALRLAPGDPDVLTTAARIYQNQGKSGKAAKLLRKVVAQEQRQQSAAFAASAPASGVADNPFVGLTGQGARSAAAGQAWGIADALSPDVPGGTPQGAPTWQSAPGTGMAANPFAAEPAAADPRAGMSVAARALDAILQERSAYVVQGVSVRSNDSESGLSRLTDIQAPFEVNFPVGDNRLAVRVTPVSLNAGSIGNEAAQRFGGGPAASAANPGASPGSQKDSGVGLALAFEDPSAGLKADLGTTPQGFLYSTLAGGVSLKRPFTSNGDLHWSANISRRPVTDSLLSFAGARDARTGQSWGGVTANGGRAELSYDDSEAGVYVYGAWHRLLGNHVESNSRGEFGSGIYWYLQNETDQQLTAGLSMTGITYDKNLGHYTYGHGGYFSPQTFFALGVPVSWSQRFDKLSYQLKGSVGVQFIDQDEADYFPGDASLQAAASSVLGRPATYGGESKTGLGYSLYGAAEYQFGPNFFMGGHLALDNAQDYRQWNSGMYLRYMFEEMSRPQIMPVNPYRSPYSN
ncbi:cellulose biosynthesis protein BcsC [Phytopseudomonas dryadis]|uniref:Cellulose synthase n=1 Tax=Phytopseudomonas dryadis TaxID=2487520 RepID=A0A4Q9R5J5_9GAMM|nr:cellulose biosynthesis protein BcsC [Pseudomonas dryadis]TBU95623.1 cellulose synthase [Pseudomonas dryadis]